MQETHTDAIWNSTYSEVPNNGADKLAFGRSNTNELGLGPLWADEYLEHSINLDNNMVTKNESVSYDGEASKSTTEHSKLMKYMSNKEGDIRVDAKDEKLESGDDPYEKWIEEATNRDGALERNTINEIGSAEAWADELKQENAMTMGNFLIN